MPDTLVSSARLGLVLCTLLAFPTPVPVGTATARTVQGNPVFHLKAFLRVRGPVRQLSEANTLLVLANAGAVPIPITLSCMTVRYRVFEAGTPSWPVLAASASFSCRPVRP